MRCPIKSFFFFFNDTATTEIYTLSLHDALPICSASHPDTSPVKGNAGSGFPERRPVASPDRNRGPARASNRSHPRAADRKSTRLNSSHSQISYAVFCLKKKKKENQSSVTPFTIT